MYCTAYCFYCCLCLEKNWVILFKVSYAVDLSACVLVHKCISRHSLKPQNFANNPIIEFSYFDITSCKRMSKCHWCKPGPKEAHVQDCSSSMEQMPSCQHPVAAMINYNSPTKATVTGQLMTHCSLPYSNSDKGLGFKSWLLHDRGLLLFFLIRRDDPGTREAEMQPNSKNAKGVNTFAKALSKNCSFSVGISS